MATTFVVSKEPAEQADGGAVLGEKPAPVLEGPGLAVARAAAVAVGQLLHHAAQAEGDNLERYRSAAKWLSSVTFIDDRARLFHGWATLFLARAEENQHAVSRALAEIDEAMRKWACASRDPKDRLAWGRQVERLRGLGYDTNADELVAFGQQHARWDQTGTRP